MDIHFLCKRIVTNTMRFYRYRYALLFYGKIKPITRMKKNTTRETNGVLGEAHGVGCTLKRSFVKI